MDKEKHPAGRGATFSINKIGIGIFSIELDPPFKLRFPKTSRLLISALAVATLVIVIAFTYEYEHELPACGPGVIPPCSNKKAEQRVGQAKSNQRETPQKEEPSCVKESRFLLRDGDGAFYICSYEMIRDSQIDVTIHVQGTPDRTIAYAPFHSRLYDRANEILKADLGEKAPNREGDMTVRIANLGDVTGHLGLFPAVIDDVEAIIFNEARVFTFGDGDFLLSKVKVDFQGNLSVWIQAIGNPNTIELARLEEMIRESSNRALNRSHPPRDNLIQNAISNVIVENCGAIKEFVNTDRC